VVSTFKVDRSAGADFKADFGISDKWFKVSIYCGVAPQIVGYIDHSLHRTGNMEALPTPTPESC
jgi:hypothetical protein